MHILQLPHPGGEHAAKVNNEWIRNDARHGRRFMLGQGSVANPELKGTSLAEFAFWGEYEAICEVQASYQSVTQGNGHPKRLWKPKGTPQNVADLMNTDPNVFGDHFRYAICNQRSNESRNLEPGSLIMFGSTLGGVFVLDTLMVVKDATPHNQSLYKEAKLDPELFPEYYMQLTMRSIYERSTTSCLTKKEQDILSCTYLNGSYKMYRGVRYEDREDFNGMFSFVPCRVKTPGMETADLPFSRPKIELPDTVGCGGKPTKHYLNPKSLQAARAIELTGGLKEAKCLWDKIVEQIKDQGLQLATHIDLP